LKREEVQYKESRQSAIVMWNDTPEIATREVAKNQNPKNKRAKYNTNTIPPRHRKNEREEDTDTRES